MSPSLPQRSPPSARSTPLLALPERPLPWARVARRLREALRDDWDFAEGRIFGSMCTQPLAEAVRAARGFSTANLGNPGLCPGTARLEEELIALLLRLYHAPPFGAGGWVVSGATEANLTALWMARNATGGREVVLPTSAHFSFSKALDLLGLRPRWVPVDDRGRMRVERAGRAVNRRTAALVGIAGSTELGAVDPLADLSELAVAREVPLHVDAALGGFVLPWLPARREGGERRFDLGLPGVSSLAVDPHKMGMAPVPAGVLLVRRREMAEVVGVPSPYLSTPQAASLLGTRPSSAVAATFTALMRCGHDGYRRRVERCLALTRRVLEGGRGLGLRPVTEPELNVVAFHHPRPTAVQAAMLTRRWDVSAIPRPLALRFVLMPHATTRSVERMLADLGKVLRIVPPAAS